MLNWKSLFSTLEERFQGSELSDPLQESTLFPKMVSSMVAVGESTGTLDETGKSHRYLWRRGRYKNIAAMMSMIEPAMIVIIVDIVGFIWSPCTFQSSTWRTMSVKKLRRSRYRQSTSVAKLIVFKARCVGPLEWHRGTPLTHDWMSKGSSASQLSIFIYFCRPWQTGHRSQIVFPKSILLASLRSFFDFISSTIFGENGKMPSMANEARIDNIFHTRNLSKLSSRIYINQSCGNLPTCERRKKSSLIGVIPSKGWSGRKGRLTNRSVNK